MSGAGQPDPVDSIITLGDSHPAWLPPGSRPITASGFTNTEANTMQTRDQALTEIATQILDIETLDTRKSDRLDFHELAVWQIKKALEAAYAAGREAK